MSSSVLHLTGIKPHTIEEIHDMFSRVKGVTWKVVAGKMKHNGHQEYSIPCYAEAYMPAAMPSDFLSDAEAIHQEYVEKQRAQHKLASCKAR